MVSLEHPVTRPRQQIRPRPDARLALQALVANKRTPLALLLIAGLLLVASLFLPYWQITLRAPQYPKGLPVSAYLTHLSGQVKEVDGLNHYIGMMKLDEAAKFERAVARFAVPALAALAVASFWVRGRWKWLVLIPVVAFPLAFVVDLWVWLYYAGHNLDHRAALSSSIKPFTPHIIGVGKIGQFSTRAHFGIGFYFAVIAAVLAVLSCYVANRQSHAAR